MFLPNQMTTRYPVGFPFIANGGMWGDLIIVSMVLYIIGGYVDRWSFQWVLAALLIGMAVSWAMHDLVYLKGRFPDSLAGGGRELSSAGMLHVLYFGTVLAAILLFFFNKAEFGDVLAVSILLSLHIMVANHIPLKFVQDAYHFSWCPNVLDEESSSWRILLSAEAVLGVATALKLFGKQILEAMRYIGG